MAGTRSGGLKAAAQNKQLYGEDFFKRIGRAGGKISRSGGFASDLIGEDGISGRDRARIAGVKGGTASRRNKPEVQEYVPPPSKYSVFELVKGKLRVK